ncbi:Lrp/AsnC family transcriptional regulator [Candidatus Micrarchaeota archaeon]|nr:Lrp/AsnC family transcriptional regulator [Candidatus Micrarchaeota archaeon]MBI5177499.1 Lrp/AsnC family transcriptional regulator [Candidatus Micrarchaeota archaeon]
MEIIDELGKNSRLSEKKIAQKTGIPMTTVHNRVKKLVESGVIRGYSLRLDFEKMGRPITAFVMVKAAAKADQKKILAYVSSKPSVFEAAMITGEFDVLFKARVENMNELNRLVVQDLRRNELISDTRTMISYETIEK